MNKMPRLSDKEMRVLEAVCDFFYDSNLDGEVIVFNEAGVGCGLGLNEAHDYLFSIYHKVKAQRERGGTK